MRRFKLYWLAHTCWWKVNKLPNMLMQQYFMHTGSQVHLSNLNYNKISGSSMIYVVQIQQNQVIYQGTRVDPCKGGGMVNHALKLRVISTLVKCDLLLLWKKGHTKKGFHVQLLNKGLGIQLCTLLQLVTSLIMVVVKNQQLFHHLPNLHETILLSKGNESQKTEYGMSAINSGQHTGCFLGLWVMSSWLIIIVYWFCYDCHP